MFNLIIVKVCLRAQGPLIMIVTVMMTVHQLDLRDVFQHFTPQARRILVWW